MTMITVVINVIVHNNGNRYWDQQGGKSYFTAAGIASQ